MAQKKISGAQVNVALGDLSNVDAPTPNNDDVLKWDGANWVSSAPSGGGGSHGFDTWYYASSSSMSFDGNMFAQWNASVVHNPYGHTQLVGSYNDQIEFQAPGTYRVTITARLSGGGTLPDDSTAYGIQASLTGGSVFSPNPTYHVRHTPSSSPGWNNSFSFAPGDASNAGSNITWTDTFIVQVSSGVQMGLAMFAYSYTNSFFSLDATMQVMIEQMSTDAGS